MLLVEVNSMEKDCKVLINMDLISEIAPLREGGSAIFFLDSAGVGAKSSMKVTDSYEMFKQFALQTVSAEDIARKFPKVSATKVETEVKEVSEESTVKKAAK